MAHSYIYAKSDSETERMVTVQDSILLIFCYFFLEISKFDFNHDRTKDEVCTQYRMNLLDPALGSVEILLDEISGNIDLKNWYLLTLAKLDCRLDDFGSEIDYNYLNTIPELSIGHYPGNKAFKKSFPTSFLKNLIADILWVLRERSEPSGMLPYVEMKM